MKADADQGEAEQGFPAAPAVRARPIEAGPDGHLVWRHLKATWLTHHFVSDQEIHVKGGYSWDTSRYLPVMTLDQEGQPVLGFARTTPG